MVKDNILNVPFAGWCEEGQQKAETRYRGEEDPKDCIIKALRAQLAAVKSELRDAYRDGNNRVDSLYAETARLKERCEALQALAEALEARNEHIQENGALMFGLDDDDLDDDLLCKIDTARARLAALGEGSV